MTVLVPHDKQYSWNIRVKMSLWLSALTWRYTVKWRQSSMHSQPSH